MKFDHSTAPVRLYLTKNAVMRSVSLSVLARVPLDEYTKRVPPTEGPPHPHPYQPPMFTFPPASTVIAVISLRDEAVARAVQTWLPFASIKMVYEVWLPPKPPSETEEPLFAMNVGAALVLRET